MTPGTTSFGQSPFSSQPIFGDRFSQFSSCSSQRHSNVSKRRPLSRDKIQKGEKLRHTRAEMSDQSDDDDSDFTSITQRCTVHSTTGSGENNRQPNKGQALPLHCPCMLSCKSVFIFLRPYCEIYKSLLLFSLISKSGLNLNIFFFLLLVKTHLLS